MHSFNGQRRPSSHRSSALRAKAFKTKMRHYPKQHFAYEFVINKSFAEAFGLLEQPLRDMKEVKVKTPQLLANNEISLFDSRCDSVRRDAILYPIFHAINFFHAFHGSPIWVTAHDAKSCSSSQPASGWPHMVDGSSVEGNQCGGQPQKEAICKQYCGERFHYS